MAKRIFSLFLCSILIVSCLTLPSYASSSGDNDVNIDVLSQFTSFFDWVFSKEQLIANSIWNIFDKDVCPGSSDYNGLHNFVEKRTQVDGKVGLYYVCEYCGKSAGEVAQQSYEEYVSDLPAPIITSDGSCCWKIIPDVCSVYNSSGRVSDSFTVLSDRFSFSATVKALQGSEPIYIHLGLSQYFYASIDGIYTLSSYVISCENIDNLFYDMQFDKSVGYYKDSVIIKPYDSVYPVFYLQIFQIYESIGSHIDMGYVDFPVSYEGYLLLSCIPQTPSNEIYNIESRPTTITGGNYGIVGDNGQLTVVNGDIINETNNTYYNPATGNTETITNWSYDYSDRSYSVTLGDGSTAKVTYGDENITIIEGDVTYNIYYIIEGSGGGSDSDPDPSATPDLDPFESSGPGYPPEPSSPPSGGGDDTGLFEWLDNLIQYLREHLSGAVDLVKSFFTEIPGLFNGFLEFLSAMFPFIPDEIMLLFTFGIAAVVFVGIIKAIRR